MRLTRRRASGGVAGEDDGVALVTVALWLPVLVIVLSFVIDIGNWFVHRRHLQMQADAAALAAAGDFSFPCSPERIEDRAVSYGGRDWNAQIGGTPASKVHMAINSKQWPLQTGSAYRVDPIEEGDPCATGMIDVKMTETDLPFWFQLGGVDFINAHARVEIRKASETAGPLPVTALDVNPKHVRVEFVDEAAAGRPVIKTSELRKTGAFGANGEIFWSNAPVPDAPEITPASLDIRSSKIGVRVVTAFGANRECGQALVKCYDADSGDTVEGLGFIRGWSGEGSGTTEARARDVRLTSVGCDPYFSVSPTACSVGIDAAVDFGTGSTDPTTTTSVGAELRWKRAGAGGQGQPLTYDHTTKRWTATGINVNPDEGPVAIELLWSKSKNCAKEAICSGSFGAVQRTFAGADARSGPVELVRIADAGGNFPANSFQRCSENTTSCTQELTVTVGLRPNFEDAKDRNDPIRELRVEVEGGEGTQSLDCDPDRTFEEELAYGCRPQYVKNTGQDCPSQAVQRGLPQPWNCVGVVPGNRLPQANDGLNLRILGDANATQCPTSVQNKWSTYWLADGSLSPTIAQDPRLVQLFVAPMGTFDIHGADETVPVTDFAYFYVTGWSGEKPGPCAGHGDDPVPGDGYIVGHFVDYIPHLETGQTGSKCDLSDISTCVRVMTR